MTGTRGRSWGSRCGRFIGRRMLAFKVGWTKVVCRH